MVFYKLTVSVTIKENFEEGNLQHFYLGPSLTLLTFCPQYLCCRLTVGPEVLPLIDGLVSNWTPVIVLWSTDGRELSPDRSIICAISVKIWRHFCTLFVLTNRWGGGKVAKMYKSDVYEETFSDQPIKNISCCFLQSIECKKHLLEGFISLMSGWSEYLGWMLE